MKDAGNEIDGKEGNTDFDIRMRKNCPKCGKGEDILEDILQGENILHILEDWRKAGKSCDSERKNRTVNSCVGSSSDN